MQQVVRKDVTYLLLYRILSGINADIGKKYDDPQAHMPPPFCVTS